jgi:hypothetical protein
VPVDLQPAPLARLVDYAERPRVGGWSLRSALVRYAQPQPQRVSNVLDAVRRIEFALRPHLKLLEREGPALWAAHEGRDTGSADDGPRGLVLGLLDGMAQLDGLGDLLAAWAVDRSGPPPDPVVDAVTAAVGHGLDALGILREEPRPTRARR